MTLPVAPVLPVGTVPEGDTFVIQSQPPNVGFLKRAVQPPSQVYVETSDVLVVACATGLRDEVLTVSYRLLRFDGILIHGQFTIEVPPTRTVVTHAEQLAEGFLLSLSCTAAVAPTRGATFARAYITKPSLGAGQPSYMLMADYVTKYMAPAFPGGRILDPTEGPGLIYTVGFATPGLGADWNMGNPLNSRWRIISILAQLRTSAVVASRNVAIQIIPQGVPIYWAAAFQSLPASSVGQFAISAAQDNSALIPDLIGVTIPPDIILPSASSINSLTTNLDGGDQWSSIEALVEEWLDNV